jgi:DNA-binding transcriptional MocR family regulator
MNTPAVRKKRSAYMEWAKTRSHAKFNLATSGLLNLPFKEFPLKLEDIELTAPGGYGYEPLIQRLARHTGVPEECVVTATGTSLANHLAMAAVLDPGDEVLMELPVYGPILDVAEYLGARIERLSRRFDNDFAIDLAELAKAITPNTRLIALTNLHNPSGALIPAETLRAIGELAQRARAYVLVDEVYLEMLFGRSAPFCFPIGEALAGEGENPSWSPAVSQKFTVLAGCVAAGYLLRPHWQSACGC